MDLSSSSSHSHANGKSEDRFLNLSHHKPVHHSGAERWSLTRPTPMEDAHANESSNAPDLPPISCTAEPGAGSPPKLSSVSSCTIHTETTSSSLSYASTASSRSEPTYFGSRNQINSANGSHNASYRPHYPNESFSMVQRSGKDVVRICIASIRQTLQDHSNNGNVPTLPPPYNEIASLASCCEDDYYRVVVSDMGGIPVILSVMSTFPADENLQAWSCIALGNLCHRSTNYQASLLKLDGLMPIITALRNYPTSVLVTNASVDALMKATSLSEPSILKLKMDVPDLSELLSVVPDEILSVSSVMNKHLLLKRLASTHGIVYT